MRNIYILCFMAMLLLACKKKQQEIELEGKRYPVTFNTQELKQSIEKLSAKSSSDSALAGIQITYLYLFNSAGESVHYEYQQPFDPYFGRFRMVLQPGNYHGIFTGLKNTWYTPVSWGSYAQGKLVLDSTDGGFFYKKVNFSVIDTGLVRDVTLERIVGKLTVKLKDSSLPASVDHIVYEGGIL